MKNPGQTLSASFRDPSGFLFTRDGVLYRQVNRGYADDYRLLMESGLYDRLVKAGLLVKHTQSESGSTEKDFSPADPERAYTVIRPERVPFISYPYEWTFGQLKDAALATLSIQRRALKAGMSLKDASAYNIQFLRGRPTLVDTLSFEAYQDGEPWVAYRQFCQHFLAPLALMSTRDVRLGQLLRIYIDGIPLDLASRLLPGGTHFKIGLTTHIHLHSRLQTRYSDVALKEARQGRKMNRTALLGLIENLSNTIRKLNWAPAGTEWVDYYESTNYSDEAFTHKANLIGGWLAEIQPKMVWDLGANTGRFSRKAAELEGYIVAFDIDPAAVELNYLQVKKDKTENLLPLVLDLTNPSPAIGWANSERDSLAQRGPADAILALALVHHLAISNNVPIPRLVDFFAGLGEWLIVEFVPKSDTQVQRLLRSREDIFPDYTREAFEACFKKKYDIRASSDLRDSQRNIYLMRRKKGVG